MSQDTGTGTACARAAHLDQLKSSGAAPANATVELVAQLLELQRTAARPQDAWLDKDKVCR